MIWPKLPERAKVSIDEHRQRIGERCTSVWVTLGQEMLDTFAAATGDDAFIHTDPQAAARTRFGGTISPGLLTLSLLPWLMRSAVPDILNRRMGVNYGYDKVRFLAPVPCGARVRGHFTLGGIENGSKGLSILRYAVSVEIEGVDKPGLVADWLIGCWLGALGSEAPA
jgi:acyl dehydratase